MESFFIWAGSILLLMMVAVLYRTIIGPTSVDRMIGVNVIGTKTTILLIIIGAIYGKVDMFLDLAVAYSMLNFLGSIAAARLLKKERFTDNWPEYDPDKMTKRESL